MKKKVHHYEAVIDDAEQTFIELSLQFPAASLNTLDESSTERPAAVNSSDPAAHKVSESSLSMTQAVLTIIKCSIGNFYI